MIGPLHLPTLNACLNFLACICLLAGFRAIKKGQRKLHRRWMITALGVSVLFMSGYVLYHAQHGSQRFPELGFIKTVYLTILVPHIILAAVMVPMILMTFYRAYREDWVRHKQIARWTFPIWLYVSVTGVIIYLMLYQIFPTA